MVTKKWSYCHDHLFKTDPARIWLGNRVIMPGHQKKKLFLKAMSPKLILTNFQQHLTVPSPYAPISFGRSRLLGGLGHCSAVRAAASGCEGPRRPPAASRNGPAVEKSDPSPRCRQHVTPSPKRLVFWDILDVGQKKSPYYKLGRGASGSIADRFRTVGFYSFWKSFLIFIWKSQVTWDFPFSWPFSKSRNVQGWECLRSEKIFWFLGNPKWLETSLRILEVSKCKGRNVFRASWPSF